VARTIKARGTRIKDDVVPHAIADRTSLQKFEVVITVLTVMVKVVHRLAVDSGDVDSGDK
jgi:hypothetical protein